MAALAIFKAKEKYNNIDNYRNDVVATLRLRLKREFENLELGELVDDDVRNEHKRCFQFADYDLITQRIEEITRLAMEEQDDENLQSFLKAESKTFLHSVLDRNKQHKKNAKEYMNNLHLKFIAKYEKKTEEFLEIHPPLVFKHPIILQSFHNKTTQRLLEKYKKLHKPGTIAFKKEYERRLLVAFEEENISEPKRAIRYEEATMTPLLIFAFIFYIFFAMILTFGLYYLHTQGDIISDTKNKELDSEYVINGTSTSIIDGLNNQIQFLESQVKRWEERRDTVSVIDEKILRNFNEKIANLTSEKINLQTITDRCNKQSATKLADINRYEAQITNKSMELHLCNAQNANNTGQIDRCNAENKRKAGQIDRCNEENAHKTGQLNRCFFQSAIKSTRDNDTIMNLNSQIRSLGLEKNLSAIHIPHKVSAMFEKRIHQHDITDNTIIGINIGSKYCHSAVYFAGKVYKIPHYDQSGGVYQSMSTYVGVDKFDAYVGQSAQKKVETSVDFSTIFYDVIHFLQHERFKGYISDTKHINFGFKPNSENTETARSVLLANNQTYLVADILSKIFRKLRDNASRILNVNVSKCVIAYSGERTTIALQKNLIKKGAEMAGFNEVTFLYVAYAAATGLFTTKNTWRTPSTIFYINFDSRYWEFSVFLKVQNNFITSDFEKYYGNIYDIGYLQNKLINYCLEEFIRTHKVFFLQMSLKSDTIENQVRFRRLHESCDRAIISLSASKTATVYVTKFAHGVDLVVNITRAKFEELCANALSQITEWVNKVLTRATLKISDIDYVIITGGSSRIPKVQEIVTTLFGNKIVDLMGMEPDEVLAYSAAIQGTILAQK